MDTTKEKQKTSYSSSEEQHSQILSTTPPVSLPLSCGLIFGHSPDIRDESTNKPESNGEKRPRLQEQIYIHVIATIKHVVDSTV